MRELLKNSIIDRKVFKQPVIENLDFILNLLYENFQTPFLDFFQLLRSWSEFSLFLFADYARFYFFG